MAKSTAAKTDIQKQIPNKFSSPLLIGILMQNSFQERKKIKSILKETNFSFASFTDKNF